MAGSNPIQPVEICSGLSLSSRIKLIFTVRRGDATVTPLDEWKLKRSLVDFLKTSPSLPGPVTVSEEDISIRRYKDLKKRKREDPVAEGSIFIRDLGFIEAGAKKVRSVGSGDGDGGDFRVLKEELSRWRNVLVEKMNDMKISLQGVKFELTVSSPVSDDFNRTRKEWEEHYAFGNHRGFSRSEKHEPDTIILRHVPSRWFAEPRVSSKPSMLVTHTIFSTLGKIRNLHVAEDNDPGNDADEDGVNMAPGLYCKIVAQFDNHSDFCNVMKILCGRSLQKEGSRLKADYELSWDKDGFFKSGRSAAQGRNRYYEAPARHSQYRDAEAEVPRRQPYTSRYSPENNVRSKRFKE